jgi:hypothetical protein
MVYDLLPLFTLRLQVAYSVSDNAARWITEESWFDFSLLQIFHTGCGATQPFIRWVPGANFLGVKRPDREIDGLPPSSAEVNKQLER